MANWFKITKPEPLQEILNLIPVLLHFSYANPGLIEKYQKITVKPKTDIFFF